MSASMVHKQDSDGVAAHVEKIYRAGTSIDDAVKGQSFGNAIVDGSFLRVIESRSTN